jgi:IS30 family transposase
LKEKPVQRTDIAKEVGVHKSTISRELRRNTGQRGYRAKQAHSMATTASKPEPEHPHAAVTWTLVSIQALPKNSVLRA